MYQITFSFLSLKTNPSRMVPQQNKVFTNGHLDFSFLSWRLFDYWSRGPKVQITAITFLLGRASLILYVKILESSIKVNSA